MDFQITHSPLITGIYYATSEKAKCRGENMWERKEKTERVAKRIVKHGVDLKGPRPLEEPQKSVSSLTAMQLSAEV